MNDGNDGRESPPTLLPPGNNRVSAQLQELVTRAVQLAGGHGGAFLAASDSTDHPVARMAAVCGLETDRARTFVAPLDRGLEPALERSFGAPCLSKSVFRTSQRVGLLAIWGDVAPSGITDELLSLFADQAVLQLELAEACDARTRADLLQHAGAVLAEAVDPLEMLGRLADLIVPRLADACFVDEVNEEGDSVPFFIRHADEKTGQAIEATLLRRPLRGASSALAERAARSGQVELQSTPETPGDPVLDDLIPVRSMAAVPLVAQGRVVGVLTFVSAESGRRFGARDRRLFEALGFLVAPALENARRSSEATSRRIEQEEFVRMAAHELRTPISALILHLQMMERRVNTPGAALEALESVRRSLDKSLKQARGLVWLSDHLLDASRLKEGLIHLDREAVDLAEVVRDAAAQLDAALAHAGCRLDLDLGVGVSGLWDRLRLEQVVMNLLTNALKYAPGKPIVVTLQSDEDTARLRVSDRGPGISRANRERVFERFVRGNGEATTSGWGLGLFICRQLVEAHGGAIYIESTPEAGTTFIVRLPRRPPRGDQEQTRPPVSFPPREHSHDRTADAS